MLAVLVAVCMWLMTAARSGAKAGAKGARGGRRKAFAVLGATLGAVAAAAGTTVPAILGEIPLNFTQAAYGIARLSVTAPSLVTGNAANSGTINIRQMRAGAAVATIATLALVAGVNLAAEVPSVIPITGSPVLLPGDVLDVQYVQIGTGLALPAGTHVKAEIQ